VDTAALLGHSILVLEDEPLIALEIIEALRRAGASVFGAHTVRDALPLAGRPDLSAAILDLGLGDGDGEPLFSELRLRGIPFVVYSGYPKPASADDVPFIQKPARTDALVDAVGKLLH